MADNDEILTFLDFFQDHYSVLYLIATTATTVGLWCIVLGVGWCIGSEVRYEWSTSVWVTAVMSAFFDLTSGAANAGVESGPTMLYALGAVFHFVAIPIHMFIPRDGGDIGNYRVDVYLCYLMFIGEILELAAIVMSLNDECEVMEVYDHYFTETSEESEDVPVQWIICFSVLSFGAPAILLFFSWMIRSNPDLALKILVYGFQITYIFIVVVAAISDWRRLLWLLPEVPLELISLYSRPT